MAEYLEVPTPGRPHPRGADRGRPGRLPAALPLGHAERRGAVPDPRPCGDGARPAGRRPTRAPGTASRRPGRSPSAGRGSPTTWSTCWRVLHHLGIDEFVTLGWSGGGPRALACAAILPGRCLAAASLAGVAPYDVDGPRLGRRAWREENVEEFAAAVQGASTYHQFLRSQPGPEPDTTPADLVESLGGLLTPTDAAALTGEFADVPARVDPEGAGAGRGRLARRRPGDRRAVGIRRPRDRRCRRRSGTAGRTRWCRSRTASGWRAHVPDARSHLFDDQGHLSLWSQVDAILAELKELAGV